MHRLPTLATVLSVFVCLPVLVGQSIEHKKLDQPTVVQGFPCDQGEASFYSDGHLQRCAISRDLLFGEAYIPAKSIIVLRPDGTPLRALLLRATEINGVHCAGAGLLGPGEGSTTDFYPSGKVKLCFLDGDQTVQGVPCARGGFWKATLNHELPVEFAEDGKLKSCGLSADFQGQHPGDKFVAKP